MNLDVDRFLEDVSGRYARLYKEAIQEMLIFDAMSNRPAFREAEKKLNQTMVQSMGIAEILGASLALRKAAKFKGDEQPGNFRLWNKRRDLLIFAAQPSNNVLPRVTFQEALDDMVSRTPLTLRPAAQRSAQAIGKAYSKDRVVAFAKSAEGAVTDRVQKLIAQSIREGVPEATSIVNGRFRPGAGRLISMGVKEVAKATEPWAEAYSKMVFRTNMNTAVTAGRFRQVQDPDIRSVIPAFRFDAVGDADTRDNHEAADGLIFRVDNLIWNKIAPPLGYNCRCQLRYMGLPELRRLGRISPSGDVVEDRLPSNAFPDVGFRHGGRPDLFIVGAA